MRLSRGLTQSELAQPRYTAAYVSTLEAGRRRPSEPALAYFAKKLGVEPDELATGRPADLPARLDLRLQEARVALSKGSYPQAQTLFIEVAEAATRYGLVRLRGRAEVGLGRTAERRGATEQALEHFEVANRLLSEEPSPLRVEAVAGIARCTQTMGDIRYAIHILESYLGLLEREGLADPVAVMRATSALVWPYSEVGLTDRAADAARRALELEARVTDPEQVANMHINVARALLDSGNIDDALESLKQAEAIYESLHWEIELARAHLARGIILTDQNRPEEARQELVVAAKLLGETGSNRDRARALNELARVERLLGDVAGARELLEESVTLLEEGDVAELALAHRLLGLCYADQDRALAEKHLRQAIDLYRLAEKKRDLASAYRDLGDLLSGTGDLDAARGVFREGLAAVEGP